MEVQRKQVRVNIFWDFDWLDKPKKKELTEKQGYEVILRYINEQNKPFSPQTIFENLHKEVKKPYVVRILAQLAKE